MSGPAGFEAAGDSEIAAALEAVLLLAEEPVPESVLAAVLGTSPERVRAACKGLAEGYESQGRGFLLARVAGGYRFQTAPAQDGYVERFVREGHSARLSAAALETLAVVAYKQPVSRHQVAEIRGVSVDGVMRTLRRRGYIDEVARAPGPGQAVLYGTTPQFLEHLGLDSLDDLPPLGEFVPNPAEVEAMENRLRLVPEPSGPDPHGPGDGDSDL
jgi:segregation and condensation protein B